MIRSRKRKRSDPTLKLALTIMPEIQARRGDLRLVDIQNHSDADQRRMVRSGERQTVRRKSHIDTLAVKAGLEPREAAACQWYADAHAARYDTLGTTGSYGESSKSGKLSFDHLPSTAEQDRAGHEFSEARDGISAPLRLMFDRIVIEGWEPKPENLFRLAVRQLMHRIETWVGLDD